LAAGERRIVDRDGFDLAWVETQSPPSGPSFDALSFARIQCDPRR
jgi:hypothetical protein